MFMNRMLKIFTVGDSPSDRLPEYPIVETYDGFVLTEVPSNKVKGFANNFLFEDITDEYRIKTGMGNIDTSIPRLTENGKAIDHPAYTGKDKKIPPAGKHHYLVQFIGPVKQTWLSGVKKAGGELRDPYGGFTYIVRATEKQMQKVISLPYVRWAGHLPYDSRIERTLLKKLETGSTPRKKNAALPRTRTIPGVYTVEFFGPKDVSNALPEVKRLGFNVLNKEVKGKLLIVETAKPERILKLSMVHGVRRINERVINRPSNDVAAGIMGTAVSMGKANGSLKLSGKGEIIGICDTGLDTGDPKNIHKDFEKRIKWIKSYPITTDFDTYINNPGGDDGPADLDSGHGTHVAGSVLSSGANSKGLSGTAGPIRGLAYNAKLVFQAVEQELDWKDPKDLQDYGRYLLAGIPNDLTNLFMQAYQKGARIHSNSWGGGKPGEYDEQSRQLDQFVWDHKDFCILVAAGNDGTDQDGDGQINEMSVTSPATAKNCITVGACENKRTKFNNELYGDWWPTDYPVAPYKKAPMADQPDQVVAFSSRGPTRDKRFKPDVVAPGTWILSTRSTMIAPNNTAWAPFTPSKKYFFMGGTSMATPLTAGAVALIREYLRTKQKIAKPSAALLKATLIAGAVRLPATAPNGTLVDNHQGYGRVNLDAVLSPGKGLATFIDLTKGLRTGEVHTTTITIKSGAGKLKIVLAYSDYPGLSLVNNLNLILTAPNGKKYTGNQSGTGTAKMDTINNVEMIEIDKPSAGNWRLDVVASNVLHGPQDFALVYLV
jgi:subtilisin family serine protease